MINQTVAYRTSCAPNDLSNTLLKFCKIIAERNKCLTIYRETEAVRGQVKGVTTNLPDVMTLSTEDKSDRHTTVAHPDVDTFHRAVATIAVLAQCFALLPVHGVMASSTQALRCVGSKRKPSGFEEKIETQLGAAVAVDTASYQQVWDCAENWQTCTEMMALH